MEYWNVDDQDYYTAIEHTTGRRERTVENSNLVPYHSCIPDTQTHHSLHSQTVSVAPVKGNKIS